MKVTTSRIQKHDEIRFKELFTRFVGQSVIFKHNGTEYTVEIEEADTFEQSYDCSTMEAGEYIKKRVCYLETNGYPFLIDLIAFEEQSGGKIQVVDRQTKNVLVIKEITA